MVIIAEKINETTKKSIERKAFLEVTTNIELKIKKLHTKYKKPYLIEVVFEPTKLIFRVPDLKLFLTWPNRFSILSVIFVTFSG